MAFESTSNELDCLLTMNQEMFVLHAESIKHGARYQNVSIVLAIKPNNLEPRAFDTFHKVMQTVKSAQVVGSLNQSFFLVYLCEPICISQNYARAIHFSIRHFFSEVKHSDERMYRYLTSGKVGVSVLGMDTQSMKRAVVHASQATLAQPAGHKSRIQFYNTDLQLTIKRYVLLEDLVRDAIEKGEVGVQYQPIISCLDWKVAGYEALCRFNIDTALNATTTELIGLAEDLGVISDLDLLTYQSAFSQCAPLLRKSGNFLNLNLSPNTQQNLSEVLECMALLAKQEEIEPKQIIIDINEVKSPAATLDVTTLLPEFRQRGIQFSLDDLSEGFRLADLLSKGEFKYLRVSRDLIERSHKQGEYYQVIKLLVRLCHRLDVQVIAEGIETPDEARLLSYLGVDYMQGYLFAKPVDYSELQDTEKHLDVILRQLHADGMTDSSDVDEEATTLLHIASKSLPRLDPGDPLILANEYLKPDTINVIPVINKGECVGLVDRASLNLHLTPAMGTEHETMKEANIWRKPVASMMDTQFTIMDTEVMLTDVFPLIKEGALSLPIVLVSNNRYKGLVTETEVTHYLLELTVS
ncbi:EAL domain-containing protein [Vibrio diazotrophicus]|uniref:EAL domain-containing protein n=1 Tax=Vibrio diazotrophicus TaxID=685 RepID=UPI000C9DDFAE|nr:EAL domain-containing protein [Vibrio diazotrophicus]PNH93668.1 EAL domain-containing protein [Vibrio diazotrophicus]